MKSKKSMKPVALAAGTALLTGLAAGNLPADTNPFAMKELSGGYMQLADASGGSNDKSDQEGKYGGKKSEKEGKCGEGKCGGKNEMKQNMEGKCGEKKSEKEGKCGEGKCGSKK